MLEKEEEKDGGKFRERGERREGTGGVFRLNTLTFISALQHTYARFWGKVRALWFVHTKCSTSSPAEKRHNGPSVLSTPGDTHTKKHRNPCQTLERLGC